MFYAFIQTRLQLTGGCLNPTFFTCSAIKGLVRMCMYSTHSGPLGISFNQDQVDDYKSVRGTRICHGTHFDLPLATTRLSKSCIGSIYSTLLKKLETALEDHRVDDAWETFSDFKRLYGYPTKHLLHKLIGELSYSSDSFWIWRAYQLVYVTMEEKPEMLCHDTLVVLSLMLSRSQMPLPASTILRFLLEKCSFPPINMWSLVFMHLVKSKVGTYLASLMLIEISDCFMEHRRKLKRNTQFLNSVTPNTTVFNLVLNACLKVGSVLKAQEIIELMAMTGTTADSTSIAILSLIHERNGQRDEVKKLAEHINEFSPCSIHHYQLLYNSLLSLHFKFGDLDAAAETVVNFYKHQKLCSLSNKNVVDVNDKFQKGSLVSIGPPKSKTSLSMIIKPRPSLKNITINFEGCPDLVNLNEGRLELSYRSLVKFINGYARVGKVEKLNLFLMIRKQLDEIKEFDKLLNEVIEACAQLGCLNTAHDIIEDLEAGGLHIEEDSYLYILRGYCKENRLKDAKVLIKQMRKIGLLHELTE